MAVDPRTLKPYQVPTVPAAYDGLYLVQSTTCATTTADQACISDDYGGWGARTIGLINIAALNYH